MAVTFTDQEIRQNVWDEISHDVRIRPSDIHVAVSGGVVTLTGTVPLYNQKSAAAEDAWTAPGALDVINDIVVPLHRRTDAAIEADVCRVLDTDPNINATNIHVSVVDGTVSLRGTVPTDDQIQEASTGAWSVDGIVGAVNELTTLR